MASVYKRTEDKEIARPVWYIGYTDFRGRRRTVRGFTDKGETKRLAAKLEEETRLIRLGVKQPAEELHSFNKPRTLEQLIKEFIQHLRNRDASDKHVKIHESRLKRIIEEAKCRGLADLTPHRIETYLAKCREAGMGKRTSNHYLRAIKQFTRWLVKTRRMFDNPLADVPMLNSQTDRRHERRPLSLEEFALLIAAAERGKPIESISGSDRAMMYFLAVFTGYRKGELGSLTSASFNLNDDPATVTVQAAYSKHRRTDTQVLHPAVTSRLLLWFQSKEFLTSSTVLFPVSDRVPGGVDRKTSKMMERDLKAARGLWIEAASSPSERTKREHSDFLAYVDQQGRFADFHANRHTFITNLGKAGVSPKTTQTLARHSDIRLTMNVYSHTDLEEKADAIRRLPSPAQECLRSGPTALEGKNGQTVSPDGTQPKSAGDESDASEIVEESSLDATSRRLSRRDRSTPGRNRTCNLRIRSPLLYPVELRALA